MEHHKVDVEQMVDRVLLVLALLALVVSAGLVAYRHYQLRPKPVRVISSTVRATPSYDGVHIPSVGSVILATKQGKGDYASPSFKAPDYWDMYWNFNCGDDNAAPLSIQPVGTGLTAGKKLKAITFNKMFGYGTQQYTTAGSYAIHIDDPGHCSWKITLKTTR